MSWRNLGGRAQLTSRLKLYVHDYLVKNNFPAAAQHFQAEAGLGDQRAPINVQEGLLHE